VCGIAGYTHKNAVFPANRIWRVVNSLIHRGPDQQGVYESDDISLGVARLKIIDLEFGDQPIFSQDRDTVVCFNGEIYNQSELRKDLEQLGHQFYSRSDTEIVLRAFLEWDEGCFSRLRGMFAIALWTESQKRLVLARDRMGIKPLYIHRRGSELFFGSELKAILEHPEIERRINLEGLNCYLALNYVPCPHTLIEGIEKLPPGHLLEWRNGKVRLEAYWQPDFRVDPRWDENSAQQELDRLLRKSVREQLVADVPLGIWVSGGVDSSTILHYAASETSSKLKTLSVSFHRQDCDESRYFREMAAHYGTEHYEFDLNPEVDLRGVIEELPYYSDEPSADAGALPVWFLAQMSRQQVTVALSGEGADELFAGYLTYAADSLSRPLRLVPASARRLALGLLRCWPVSDRKISFEYKLKRFLEGSLLPPEQAHLYWNGAFSEREKRGLCLAADHRPVGRLLAQLPPASAVGGRLNRYLWLDQRYYLPDDILYKTDRMSMAHSLEVRPPFLDHRIVEFAASLPEQLKISGFRQKHLLKRLMRDKLPASILGRKKEGFDIPAHKWLRGPLRPLLLDTLTPEDVERTGLFRWEAVRSLIEAHLSGRQNLGYHLWGLMTLFLWMKRWQVETEPLAEETREIRPCVPTVA
jgi:asparagine synthase (glutamine-hydrolysing)